MHVPFSHLGQQFESQNLRAHCLHRIIDIINRSDFTLGKEVAEFEERMAEKLEVRHIIGVNSGTDAIKIALHAAGVHATKGVVRTQEVVMTSAHTFVATIGAIKERGLEPFMMDIGDDLCLDVGSRRIPDGLLFQVEAVVPVYWAGTIPDRDRVGLKALALHCPIIADACQALGSSDGYPICSKGVVAACYSMHPLKTLNVWGDGGFIATDDAGLAEAARDLRNHGLRSRGMAVRFGYNSRLHTIQAAVALELMDLWPAWVARRTWAAEQYDHAFRGMRQVCIPKRHVGPHANHLYILEADRRDGLLAHLAATGIEAKIHYPTPLFDQPAFWADNEGIPPEFPRARQHCATTISLPVHQYLSDEQVKYVIGSVQAFYG